MKTRDKLIFGLLIVIIVVALILAVISKGDDSSEVIPTPDEETAQPVVANVDGAYVLAAADSTIEWSGAKTIIKEWIDTGTVAAQAGAIDVDENGLIADGSIIIDMTTIDVMQTGRGSGNDNLKNHLSSADFFDVATYPTATFDITGVEVDETGEGEVILTGEMTIKSTTKAMEVPVTVTETADGYSVAGTLNIDRTEFDVQFGSDKFFDNLGDNVINDIFTLTFDLSFKG